MTYSNKKENVLRKNIPPNTYVGVYIDEVLSVGKSGVAEMVVSRATSRIVFDTNMRAKGPVGGLRTRLLRGSVETDTTVNGRGLRQTLTLLPGQKVSLDGNIFHQTKD